MWLSEIGTYLREYDSCLVVKLTTMLNGKVQ